MKISVEQARLPLSSAGKAKTAQSTSPADKAMERDRLRLRKATKELESYFVLHMLKAMRETIPKSDLLGGGLGQDVYNSLFDEKLSDLMSGGPASLAEALYRSLEKNLTAESLAVVKGDDRLTASVFEGIGPPAGRAESSTAAGPHAAARIEPADPATAPESVTAPSKAAPDRKPIPAAAPRPKITSDRVLDTYGPAIEEASRKYAVDSTLIYSVIMTESGGNPKAVSPKGAKGLMQLMDATAEQMGVADSLHPHQNIDGGAKYLRQLLNKYDGDLKRTLAAYNAGPGAVDKHRGVPPYAETRRYVDKVMGHLNRIQRRTTPVANPKGNQPESRQE